MTKKIEAHNLPPVHVAFIDDGVNEGLFNFNLKNDLEISSAGFYKRKNFDSCELTHGTICAAIVFKYCTSIICSSLKILHSDRKTANISLLCNALEWCLDNDVNVINGSLGSIDFRDVKILHEIVHELDKKGTIVVCAISNKGFVTYPASFSSVIGVKSLPAQSGCETLFHDRSFDGADLSVVSQHTITDKNGNHHLSGEFNSYAAPYVVSKICNFISLMGIRPATDYLKNIFIQNSSHAQKKFVNYIRPDWIKSALIVSKNVVDISLLADFDIVHQCSYADIDGIESYRLIFDTIICIWDNVTLEDEKQSVVNYAISMNKNIAIVDFCDSIFIVNNNFTNKCWHSKTCKPDIRQLNHELQIDIPVIIIIGDARNVLITSSNDLHNSFYSNGYRSILSMNDPFCVFSGQFYIDFKDSDGLEILAQFQRYHLADCLILSIVFDKNNNIINYKKFIEQVLPDVIINYSLTNVECNNDVLYFNIHQKKIVEEGKEIHVANLDINKIFDIIIEKTR